VTLGVVLNDGDVDIGVVLGRVELRLGLVEDDRDVDLDDEDKDVDDGDTELLDCMVVDDSLTLSDTGGSLGPGEGSWRAWWGGATPVEGIGCPDSRTSGRRGGRYDEDEQSEESIEATARRPATRGLHCCCKGMVLWSQPGKVASSQRPSEGEANATTTERVLKERRVDSLKVRKHERQMVISFSDITIRLFGRHQGVSIK